MSLRKLNFAFLNKIFMKVNCSYIRSTPTQKIWNCNMSCLSWLIASQFNRVIWFPLLLSVHLHQQVIHPVPGGLGNVYHHVEYVQLTLVMMRWKNKHDKYNIYNNIMQRCSNTSILCDAWEIRNIVLKTHYQGELLDEIFIEKHLKGTVKPVTYHLQDILGRKDKQANWQIEYKGKCTFVSPSSQNI